MRWLGIRSGSWRSGTVAIIRKFQGMRHGQDDVERLASRRSRMGPKSTRVPQEKCTSVRVHRGRGAVDAELPVCVCREVADRIDRDPETRTRSPSASCLAPCARASRTRGQSVVARAALASHAPPSSVVVPIERLAVAVVAKDAVGEQVEGWLLDGRTDEHLQPAVVAADRRLGKPSRGVPHRPSPATCARRAQSRCNGLRRAQTHPLRGSAQVTVAIGPEQDLSSPFAQVLLIAGPSRSGGRRLPGRRVSSRPRLPPSSPSARRPGSVRPPSRPFGRQVDPCGGVPDRGRR